MSMVLMGIRWPGDRPSLEEVEQRYALDPERVDHRFGVVLVDRDQHLYSLRLDREEAAKLKRDENIVGSFGDPRIAATKS
jgi:hypothetical protein